MEIDIIRPVAVGEVVVLLVMFSAGEADLGGVDVDVSLVREEVDLWRVPFEVFVVSVADDDGGETARVT